MRAAGRGGASLRPASPTPQTTRRPAGACAQQQPANEATRPHASATNRRVGPSPRRTPRPSACAPHDAVAGSQGRPADRRPASCVPRPPSPVRRRSPLSQFCSLPPAGPGPSAAPRRPASTVHVTSPPLNKWRARSAQPCCHSTSPVASIASHCVPLRRLLPRPPAVPAFRPRSPARPISHTVPARRMPAAPPAAGAARAQRNERHTYILLSSIVDHRGCSSSSTKRMWAPGCPGTELLSVGSQVKFGCGACRDRGIARWMGVLQLAHHPAGRGGAAGRADVSRRTVAGLQPTWRHRRVLAM